MLLIVSLAVAAYSNSLNSAFVFDDAAFVAANPAIRTLWPPYGWLGFCPTRFVVYFTFAVNYAIHGNDVVGYHVVNIAIHCATALALFGLIRRTLQLPGRDEDVRRSADAAAAATALIWVVHPLNTQAVTYVYQRLESLAAMWAVLSLYAFVRAYGDALPSPGRWKLVSVCACCLALLSKESVAALPLIVLCYDRLFLSTSWRGVLARRRFHAAMFCSWGVLLGVMFAAAGDYGKAGIADTEGPAPLAYALSQSGVILHYLRLSVLPVDLCLDYGWPLAHQWSEFVPQTIAVLGLLVTAGVGLYRGRAWSFPLVAFFLLLAPTSSIVPIADLMFEHRMYLPLACVLVSAVCGAGEILHRAAGSESVRRKRRIVTVCVCGGIVVLSATATHVRNRDYSSEETMWLDCIRKAPHNPRPYYLIGRNRLQNHLHAEAENYFVQALERNPYYPPARLDLAHIRIDQKRYDEATQLIEIDMPRHYDVWLHIIMGELCEAHDRFDDAAGHYATALSIDPMQAQAITHLALILARFGRMDDAAELYRQAAAVDLQDPSPRNNLGTYYAERGDYLAAKAAFEDALHVDPMHVEARSNLGSVLDKLGHGDQALAELRRALADDPSYVGSYINLGAALARRGRLNEALEYFQQAVEIDPQNSTARENLAQARLDLQPASSATNAAQAGP